MYSCWTNTVKMGYKSRELFLNINFTKVKVHFLDPTQWREFSNKDEGNSPHWRGNNPKNVNCYKAGIAVQPFTRRHHSCIISYSVSWEYKEKLTEIAYQWIFTWINLFNHRSLWFTEHNKILNYHYVWKRWWIKHQNSR